MTRDDIIKLAREAGMLDFSEPSDADLLLIELECFAALVAAAERTAMMDRCRDIIVQSEERGAAAEREACAQIANAERASEFRRPVSAHKAGQYEMAEYIYEAIRARGQA